MFRSRAWTGTGGNETSKSKSEKVAQNVWIKISIFQPDPTFSLTFQPVNVRLALLAIGDHSVAHFSLKIAWKFEWKKKKWWKKIWEKKRLEMRARKKTLVENRIHFSFMIFDRDRFLHILISIFRGLFSVFSFLTGVHFQSMDLKWQRLKRSYIFRWKVGSLYPLVEFFRRCV